MLVELKDILFFMSPKPILGGAKEKVDIGIVCGNKVLASDRFMSFWLVLLKLDATD